MSRTLLIVDDEYDILTWLEELFRYEFKPKVDVYTAQSAEQALDLLNRIKFDVVLTDIRMPGMDGIALFEQIKRNWPRCKTVFLTGYRNYDDMYKIMRHKDVRYLLKSEDDDVILQTVGEAFQELKQELEQETMVHLSREQYSEVQRLLRQKFLGGLLKGGHYTLEQLEELSRQTGLIFRLEEPFLMGLLRLDRRHTEETAQLVLEEVGQILQQNLPQNVNLLYHQIGVRQAVLFAQSSQPEMRDWQRIFAVLQGALEYTQTACRERRGGGFSAVVSSTPCTWEQCAGKLIALKELLMGYLGEEKEILIHAEKMQKQEQEPLLNHTKETTRLKAALELQKSDEYYTILNHLCGELIRRVSMKDQGAIQLYYEISLPLMQKIREKNLNTKLSRELNLYPLTSVETHSSWEEAAQYLLDVSGSVFRFLGGTHNVSDSSLYRICRYIEDHLDGDLSLTTLAEVGGFNTSYLSRLFKRNFQVNLSDYISEKRMVRAKLLLSNTNLQIQEIAAQTGYTSAHSFTRTFRTLTGVSPAEYREVKNR